MRAERSVDPRVDRPTAGTPGFRLATGRAHPATFGRWRPDAAGCPSAQLVLLVADQQLDHVVVLKHGSHLSERARPRGRADRGTSGRDRPRVAARLGGRGSGGAPGSGSGRNRTEGVAEQHRQRALLVEAVNHRHPLRSFRHTAQNCGGGAPPWRTNIRPPGVRGRAGQPPSARRPGRTPRWRARQR